MKIPIAVLALSTLSGCGTYHFSKCIEHTGVRSGQGAGEATVKLLAAPITVPACALAGMVPSDKHTALLGTGTGPTSRTFYTPKGTYTVITTGTVTTVNRAGSK